jgi:hypothetical protein
LKNKIVALKSAVDGLIVHGICDEGTGDLFNLITTDYLQVSEPILRQVTIECVCKMLFSTKMCDEISQEVVEVILVNLMI